MVTTNTEVGAKTMLWKFLRLENNIIVSDYDNSAWKIGEWRDCGFDIQRQCVGFNASRYIHDALLYVCGDILAQVEVEGSHVIGGDKQTWQRMRIVRAWRWEKRHSVMLAIFCAEQVLGIFEKEYPRDKRPREAIEAAKKWLAGPTEKNRIAALAATVDAGTAYAAAAAATSSYAAAYAACAANAAAVVVEAAAALASNAANAAAYAACAANAAAYAACAANAAAYAAEATGAKCREFYVTLQRYIVKEIIPTMEELK